MAPKDFLLDLQNNAIHIGSYTIPVLLVGPNADPWFRGNNLAEYLGYAQPRVAITKITRARDTKTFGQLLSHVVSKMETMPKDDQRARYVNEPGLYRLIGRSDMPKAEDFQDWVYEQVLPSIRKTGTYSVPLFATDNAAEDALGLAEWQGKREVARHLTKKKSDKIHDVTGGKAKAEYPKVNSALVRSVAGQIPKTLQKAHGFTDTPRNYMPAGMLGLLSYGEQQVDAELDKAYKKFGRFLSEGEVTAVAYQVTDMIYDMCKNTGGFDTPLLQSSPAPATATKKRKALAEPPKKSCKQQRLIMCH